MPFLLVHLAVADIIGTSFPNRQVVTATTIFRECTFGCRSASNGGAVYIDSKTASLFLAGCTFQDCQASAQCAGAVYARCLSFSMNKVTGLRCGAESDSFCYVWVQSAATSSLEVLELSVASGTSAMGTIYLECEASLSGTTTLLRSVNSSANSVSQGEYGSGLGAGYHLTFALRFCTLVGNARTCCLFLYLHIVNSDISCVAMFNNSCKSVLYPGVIYLASAVMMSGSVFQSNTFDYFLATSSSSTGDITFTNCVFDSRWLNKTNSLDFATKSCVYETRSTFLAQCRTQTATPRPVPISSTVGDSIPLQKEEQIRLLISAYPVFVILPDLSNLNATVYNSTDDETAKFSSRTNVFAVYFSQSVGRIVFTATAATTLKFFAIKPRFDCPVYFLSSSPRETWRGHHSGGNFTIGNSQDICLLHVSDNVTKITVRWDTERNFDFLEVEYSGTRSASYTGTGSAVDSADYFSVFRWHSNSDILSVLVSVDLSSPWSSLPYRTARGSGTSPSPIILEALSPISTPPISTPPISTPPISTRPSSALSTAAIAGIAVGGAVLIVVLIIAIWKLVTRRSASGGGASNEVDLYTMGNVATSHIH